MCVKLIFDAPTFDFIFSHKNCDHLTRKRDVTLTFEECVKSVEIQFLQADSYGWTPH